MLDKIAIVTWYASVPVAVSIVLIAIWVPSSLPLRQRVIVGVCYAAAMLLALLILALSILLRDGLGPDAEPSHGLAALSRLAEDLPGLLLCAPFAGAGWLLSRRPWPPRRFNHLV